MLVQRRLKLLDIALLVVALLTQLCERPVGLGLLIPSLGQQRAQGVVLGGQLRVLPHLLLQLRAVVLSMRRKTEENARGARGLLAENNFANRIRGTFSS